MNKPFIVKETTPPPPQETVAETLQKMFKGLLERRGSTLLGDMIIIYNLVPPNGQKGEVIGYTSNTGADIRNLWLLEQAKATLMQ